jgi:hypothetical protein
LFADNTQLRKEATLPTKSDLGQKLALERIEKRVNGFKSDLQRDMCQNQVAKTSIKARKSPKLYLSSVPLFIYKARPVTPESQPRDISETSPCTSRSSREKFSSSLCDHIPLEQSPTGFVYFPRHRDDDDDWERLSVQSVPKEEQERAEKKEPANRIGLLRSLFGGR